MAPADPHDPALTDLASHLDARREEILRAWSDAVIADADLSTPNALSRTQLRDHVPLVLAGLSGSLRGASSEEPARQAGAHGATRWQQGYNLTELMREWGHLQMCLVEELDRYAELHPSVGLCTMSAARRILVLMCSDAVNRSTERFVEMRQSEAAAQVRDLEVAIQGRQVEPMNADLVRAAAHDLRGNLGIVMSAASVLARDDVAHAARQRLFGMVERAVGSQHALLGNLSELAQLQAGQEQIRVQPFDAAQLLVDLCTTTQPFAVERGLYLVYQGPPELPVEGDPLKVRRIVQNLVLNALEYTDTGGVSVTFGDSRAADPNRWMVRVVDTGPGFEAGPSGPLAGELKAATTEMRSVEHLAGGPTPAPEVQSAPEGNRRRGEGIGLAIVKRLCELLDATLELESRPGLGSEFRVILPRTYG